MKIASVDAEFDQLKGNNRAAGRGEGSTARVAIARAFEDLLRQPNVKGTRLKTFRATVYINEKATTNA